MFITESQFLLTSWGLFLSANYFLCFIKALLSQEVIKWNRFFLRILPSIEDNVNFLTLHKPFPQLLNGCFSLSLSLSTSNLLIPLSPFQPTQILPYGMKSTFERDSYTPMSITALFTIGELWFQPRCSAMNDCIREMWFINTMEYYLPLRKNKILTFATK